MGPLPGPPPSAIPLPGGPVVAGLVVLHNHEGQRRIEGGKNYGHVCVNSVACLYVWAPPRADMSSRYATRHQGGYEVSKLRTTGACVGVRTAQSREAVPGLQPPDTHEQGG